MGSAHIAAMVPSIRTRALPSTEATNRRRSLPPAAAVVLALAAAAGGAAALAADGLPRDKDSWIQLKTPNFLLFSDAGERRTRAMGLELERVRSALGQVSPSLVLSASRPTFIFLFKDRFAFYRYQLQFNGKHSEIAGFFLQHPWGNYVAVDADREADALHIVHHEYLHYLLRNNYARLPLWLDEGLAEYYGTVSFVEGDVRLGMPVFEHIALLRDTTLIPFKQLFAIDHSSKDYHEGFRQGIFYAESWALTHYLLLGNPSRRPQLAHMVKLMEAGVTQEKAFGQSFGGSYEELEQELRTYIKRKIFPYQRTPVRLEADIPVATQPLVPADALYRLGDLMLNIGAERAPEAAEHFQAALGADPRHALAIAGLGEIEELAGRPRDAEAQYVTAAKLAPHQPFVHFLLGRCLLAQTHEAPDGVKRGRPERSDGERSDGATRKDLFERAVAELGRAAELDPGFGEAWSYLGFARLALDPASPQTTSALETAHQLLPGRTDVMLNLALSYSHTGQRDRAEALIERARVANARQEDVEVARDGLLNADYERAAKLVAASQLEEAVQALELVAAKARRDELRIAAAADLDRVRKELEHQRFVAAYNRAVALASVGDVATATTLLNSLLAATSDPADATEAQNLLDKIKAQRKPRG